MKVFLIPAVLLFVASGVGARPQEETSISVFPLPTVLPPSISSGSPPLPTTLLSLTPRPAPTRTSTGLPSATGTLSATGSQTSGTSTSAVASVTSPIASASSALSSAVSSASASASPTNNAAPARFEVHGLTALAAVFASMLFTL
ncbi:unnamed protein product [Rhizoctonia solani]|uniref:Uncharacterized protein n=1 Tax=Rhizoctonia solani TaxID=456999 RepID=A0A8H3I2B8_9AGAM|nr:unnamed protein product [Rhizoctonia solani]